MNKVEKIINHILMILAIGVIGTLCVFILISVPKVLDKYFPDANTTTIVEDTKEVIDTYGGRFEIINEYVQSDGIDGSLHYYIAYDKVTKVLYTIGKADGSSPTFTVMVGETGTPILYAGKGE